jgi:hypothetical protein
MPCYRSRLLPQAVFMTDAVVAAAFMLGRSGLILAHDFQHPEKLQLTMI